MTRIQQVLAAMLFLATTVNLNAQITTSPLNQGYWTLGLNGGTAYQSSDVNSSANGLGLGLTVGKNIYHRPGATLDFGLQGRLGYTKSTGLNSMRNYNIANNDAVNGTEGLNYQNYTVGLGIDRGFIFSNHKTQSFEGALEAVVTLNELKEKTGVKVSLYGGLGANYFNVMTNQADTDGKEYFKKYAELNDREPTSLIKKNLRAAILDDDYESYADGFTDGFGKVKIMPSIGIEAGFQVTPKFSIDIGHRTTFSGTDLLDGEQWIDGDQDILHYTYLGTTFNFNKRERRFEAPIISVLQPRNASLTHYREIPLHAKIENAESAADVELLVNGKARSFRFRKEKLSADIVLQKGENEIVLIANTFGGEDRVVLTTFFEEKKVILTPPPPPVIRNPPVVYRPIIEFIGTAQNGYRCRENEIQVAAIVKNVFEKRDIILFANGRRENFRFDPRREEIEATIRLLPGENEIILRAFNEAGETEDRMLIIFEDRLPRPVVNISQPRRNFTTRKNEVKVVAETEFIADRRDIFVTVNDREIYNVDFANNCLTAFARLKKGRNIIRVRVENESGVAETELVVFHEDRPELKEPTVKIIAPKDHENTTKRRVDIIAEVFEVARKRDIELFLNGVAVQDFEFRNNRLTASVELKKGQNKILVRAKNQDGRDEQTVIVKFERRTTNIGNTTPAVKTPVVDILSPKNNLTLDKNEVEVIAKVKHTRKAEVLINGTKLDGVTVRGGEVKAIVKLREGRNEIRVKATNKAGVFEKKVTVVFKKKEVIVVKAPTIEIIRPTDGEATEKPLEKLEANVANVTNLKNVKVTLNGKKLRNVTFRDGKLTALLALKKGKNIVEVTATNKVEMTTEFLTVIYRDKIQAPVKEQQVIKTTPPTQTTTEPVKNEEGKKEPVKIEPKPEKPKKSVKRKIKN